MSQNKQTTQVTPQRRIDYTYNPDNQPAQELMDNFVIRTKEFKRIYQDISSTELDETPQHYLIEGQRGSGKTSLMLRLRYELEKEQEKRKHQELLAIQLPEEQYRVIDLCRLWESIADHLYDVVGFESLADDLDELAKQAHYPSTCFDCLNDYLVKNNKRMVLFLDNFGDMLDKFTELELKRLRDIFHISKHIQLIAASAQTLEYTYKHDQPFYEFFKIIRLNNLNNKEAIKLLHQLAIRHGAVDEIHRIQKEQPERIETIRILTGGVPRTLVLLFEIFLDKNGNIFDDLETLLDRVTPLYKHRMDDLKRNQQAIMDVIALNWDGISTAEIVQQLKGREFDSKKVAAQLKALENNNLVSAKKVDKKNNIYFIKERFFNIWYLMRLGRRKSSDRVHWLVRFLRDWYSPADLKERVEKHIQLANKGQLNPKGAYTMCEAMAKLVPDLALQDDLYTSTKSFLEANDQTLSKELSSSDLELFKSVEKALKNNQFDKAIAKTKKISQSYQGDKEHAFSLIYNELKDFDKAIEYCLLAIEKGHSDAMFNLAFLYETELKDYDKAIKYYLLAIEKDDISAMYNLALFYENEFKDFNKAIEYYLLAIDKDHTKAMNNLALLYTTELKDYDKAIEYYLLAIEKGHTNAMYNLALLYETELKDFDKAIKYYQLAIKKGNAGAMNGLAWLYFEQQTNDKIKSAIKLAQQSSSLKADYISLDILANILLWDNQYKESDNAIRKLFSEHKYQERLSDLSDYFIFLIAKKQLHSAYNLFQDFSQLKDELKPVYYALMTLLKDEHPKEYLKMGDELESTVNEILEKIEIMREKYAN